MLFEAVKLLVHLMPSDIICFTRHDILIPGASLLVTVVKLWDFLFSCMTSSIQSYPYFFYVNLVHEILFLLLLIEFATDLRIMFLFSQRTCVCERV